MIAPARSCSRYSLGASSVELLAPAEKAYAGMLMNTAFQAAVFAAVALSLPVSLSRGPHPDSELQDTLGFVAQNATLYAEGAAMLWRAV